MNRRWHVLAALALSAASLGIPATADPGPGHFTSPNVTWVANIPLEAPAIGARVLQIGAQRRFYVSTTHGMAIWDVTNPGVPLPIGRLAMPHWENESFAVSDDGKTAFLTSDPGFGQPPLTYIVDASIPQAPHVVGVIPDGAHTATCANAACTHLYGDRGWIYDVRERANPKVVSGGQAGAAHYAWRDAAGLLWDDGSIIDPRKNPAAPTRRRVGTGGWHNNMRPNAEKYRPRKANDRSKALKPGELVVGSGETWLSPGTCDTWSSGISTWSITNFDKGQKAKLIGTITPVNGAYTDGNPPADVVGCSSHWFDYRKATVAAGWYDHGVRFFAVDEKTGAIKEVGWFQPVYSLTWGAYWIDDEYVYSVDAARGVDILKFNRAAKPPAPDRVASSWRPALFQPNAAAVAREQYVCWQVAQAKKKR